MRIFPVYTERFERDRPLWWLAALLLGLAALYAQEGWASPKVATETVEHRTEYEFLSWPPPSWLRPAPPALPPTMAPSVFPAPPPVRPPEALAPPAVPPTVFPVRVPVARSTKYIEYEFHPGKSYPYGLAVFFALAAVVVLRRGELAWRLVMLGLGGAAGWYFLWAAVEWLAWPHLFFSRYYHHSLAYLPTRDSVPLLPDGLSPLLLGLFCYLLTLWWWRRRKMYRVGGGTV
ncbi:MAG: hypothetical protein AAGK14_04030 [Verrucomicrobiota bacterium]